MTEEEYDSVVLDADELEAEIDAIVKTSGFGWLSVFIASINAAIDSLAASGASNDDMKLLADEAHASMSELYKDKASHSSDTTMH